MATKDRAAAKSAPAVDTAATSNGSATRVYTRRKLTPAEVREAKARSRLLPKDGKRRSGRREPNRDRPRLAVYERVSQGGDDSASMERQRMENEAYAAELGAVIDWELDVFWDYGISAAGGHLRQGLEALLDAVEAGDYDGVLSYEVPRVVRDEDEAEIFRSVLIKASADL